MMGILKDYNIVIGQGDAAEIFEGLLEGKTFLDVVYDTPNEYIKIYWDAYQKYSSNHGSKSSVNGKIFEYILATLLIREELVPYFISAKIAFVPNIVYDITLYTEEIGPISLSAKTSLRERYKQADLEAFALKHVHRRAKAYLICNHESETKTVREKIKSGDTIGLDDVIFAQSKEFDDLIDELRKYTLCNPELVKIIKTNQEIDGVRIINDDYLHHGINKSIMPDDFDYDIDLGD